MKQQLMKNLNTIARCGILYRDGQLADCGLTGCQTPYLPEICANPGITQDQLAQKLHVNRSSVTRQLGSLEDSGFITRRRSETDSRAIEIYPTEKAHGVLPAVQRAFRSWRQKLTCELSENEIDALETLLDRLARRAEEIR